VVKNEQQQYLVLFQAKTEPHNQLALEKNNHIKYLSLSSDFSGFRMHSRTATPQQLGIQHGAWESDRTEQAYSVQTGNLTFHYSFVQQCYRQDS